MAQSVENQEDRVNGGENGVCLGGENRGFWGFGWRWLVRRATCAAVLVCAAVREVVWEWSGGGVLWVAFCWLLSPSWHCLRSSVLPALADVEAAARRQRLHVCCVCGIWFVWHL